MFSVSASLNRANIRNLLGFFGSRENPIERVTNAVPTIDANHAQIHAKKAYSLKGEISVAQAKVGVFQLTVPAGAYIHLQGTDFVSNSGPASVTIIEDAHMTSEVGASALTPVNHHRIDPAVSVVGVKVLADAAVTNGTAPVQLAMLPLYGAGAGVAKVAAETTSAQEYILTAGIYTIALAHSVAGICKFGYKLFWYEEGAA